MVKHQTGGIKLVEKNLKLEAFLLKTLEHCSRAYDIRHVNSTYVLTYQHQWELEQKKSDNLKVPKFDKGDQAKTMEKIVLHLKLVREVRGVPLAYVVWHHTNVTHIPPGHYAYLNLDEEMISKAS